MMRPFVLALVAARVRPPRPSRNSAHCKTEDPETIGSGRMLVEAGIDYQRDVYLPVSGLRGNLFTMPAFGVSLGVSSIAEIQIDWGVYQKLSITEQVADAPLSHLLLLDGATTDDFGDIHIGAKVRLVSETAAGPRLAAGSGRACRMPGTSPAWARTCRISRRHSPSARRFNPFASSPTSA